MPVSTFIGANGTELSALDSNFVKARGAATLIVANDRLRLSSTSGQDAVYYDSRDPSSADYPVSIVFRQLSSTSHEPSALARMTTDGNTYYQATHNGAQVRLRKRVAGVNTWIDGGAVTFPLNAGQDYKLTCHPQGSTIKVFMDDVEVISVTDTSIASAGKAGMLGAQPAGAPSDTTGSHITSHSFDDAGTGSPPSGTVTIGTITHDHDSASIPWTYDAADETGYEYSLDGGAWTDAGTSPLELTGLTPETEYSIEIRAVNADGDGTASTPGTWTTDAAPDGDQSVSPGVGSISITGHAPAVAQTTLGTIVTPVLKNNTGTVLADETGVVVNVYDASTGALVVRKTGLTSSALGVVTVTDDLIEPGTTYAYEVVLSSNGRRLPVAEAA